MKRQYNLVVFDWEGTLAEDAYGQVVAIVAQEAQRMALGPISKRQAKQYLGAGLLVMISVLFPDLAIHQQEQLLENIQQRMKHAANEVILMPDAEATIHKLHELGFMLAIATNRSLSSLQQALQRSGLADYFAVLRTVSQAPAKPCPDMLEQIILECNTNSAATLMVGDSLTDVEMAKSLAVDAIAVDFYQEQRAAFVDAGACLVLDNYQELWSFLQI